MGGVHPPVHSPAVAAFRALHARGCFILPNPWDVGSAWALYRLGFPALATSSAGVAFSRGLPDDMRAMPCAAMLTRTSSSMTWPLQPMKGFSAMKMRTSCCSRACSGAGRRAASGTRRCRMRRHAGGKGPRSSFARRRRTHHGWASKAAADSNSRATNAASGGSPSIGRSLGPDAALQGARVIPQRFALAQVYHLPTGRLILF